MPVLNYYYFLSSFSKRSLLLSLFSLSLLLLCERGRLDMIPQTYRDSYGAGTQCLSTLKTPDDEALHRVRTRTLKSQTPKIQDVWYQPRCPKIYIHSCEFAVFFLSLFFLSFFLSFSMKKHLISRRHNTTPTTPRPVLKLSVYGIK